MKELQFLEIINRTLSNNTFLGEDCAFLDDLGIFVTQDTLVEGIHFDLKFTDLYTLAKKSVAVNLSDLSANLAEPKYISISLSAPKNFDETSIKQFYEGVEDSCKEYKISVCGGDLTASNSGLVISICAIGKIINGNQPKVSRSFAKENQVVCVTKNYGSSAYALDCLLNNKKCSKEVLAAHINPVADINVSNELAVLNCGKIAVMDSSDGLCDALFKIAKASHKSIHVEFEKIPYLKEIENSPNFKDLVLWGGEDYGLVFCLDEKDYEMLTKNMKNIQKIGVVKAFVNDFYVKIDDLKVDEDYFSNKCYNHFVENKNE